MDVLMQVVVVESLQLTLGPNSNDRSPINCSTFCNPTLLHVHVWIEHESEMKYFNNSNSAQHKHGRLPA